MPGYEVQHAYGAWRDGRRFGPWQAGEVVDLDPEDADWVCRDSPGALAEVAEQVAEEPEREKPASRDRQARPGRNRGRS